jgi:predicted nucleotide-binding protein (sugar kinase/HSP70/actin superfamily)
MVLDELGFKDVPIYAPNQDHRLYKELEILGGKFSRLGWWAIVATDLFIKLLHHIRPYEEEKGETNLVYREALKRLSKAIEEGSMERVTEVLRDSIKEFLAIPVRREERPVIGIVGEIYIRSNRFSNEHVISRIEELGGEVFLAPITEWINYINYMGKKKSLKYGDVKELLRIFITSFIQRNDEKRLENLFKGCMKYWKEPNIKETLEKAHPYIHESFEGEAILTVGKSIEFIEMGASGIVNTMPFTCMPGTVSSAIMKLVQDRYGVPVINVAYDGQGTTNILARLEAFMYQVKENFRG